MKKFLLIFINILSALLAIVTLVLTNISFPDGNLISVINSPIYEKTEDFYALVNNSISDIFSYINYKLSFETNDKLNYGLVIAETIDQNSGFKKWTLSDCLDIAKQHGLFIDTDYGVKIATDKNYPPFDKNNTLNFMLKTYPSSIRNGLSTESEFINEVMDALSTYNRCKSSLSSNTNFKYNITFTNKNDKKETVYKNTDMSTNSFLSSNAFIFLSEKDNIISSNINYVSSSFTKSINLMNPHPDKEYTIYCAVDTDYPKNDIYKEYRDNYNNTKDKCGFLISLTIFSLIIFLTTLFIALHYILSVEKKIEESTKLFYVLPTELHIIFYIITNFILVQAFSTLLSKNLIPEQYASIRPYFYIFTVYATTIVFFGILSSKYANDNLTPSLLKLNKDLANEQGNTTISPVLSFALIFLPIIIFILLSFYLIYLYTTINNRFLLFVGILLLISSIGFIIYLFILYGAFDRTLKAQANANNMRTSLIANVTHDIKTPLTSIISYTGLITAEIKKPSKSFKQNLTHYSKIVNDKSIRLNDLINDLIFDSKVSSGNLNIEFEKLELVQFLTKINEEFKDRLHSKGLKTIFTYLDKNVFINADSKHLYRVFQNLYSNIYKYALENSRVYMDLITNKHKVKITIKNIQKEQLEVDVKTLKDRFVRGSTSRTSEGFGLGLSIAENLIKSMNGRLDIKNVRDEFITNITFLRYED